MPLPDSLWAATAAAAPCAPPLDGSVRADVLVVGGGYTGLSTALHLSRQGVDVAVLEAETIGFGGSGRNMGQVNPGFLVLPDEVERHHSEKLGRAMNRAFAASADLVFELVQRYAIVCDAVRKGNFFLAHDRRSRRLIEAYHRQHERWGASLRLVEGDELRAMVGSPRYTCGVLDERSGTVQPLSYARGLARAAIAEGASIHEQSRVASLDRAGTRWRGVTGSGAAVEADEVVLATDSYADRLWPGLGETLLAELLAGRRGIDEMPVPVAKLQPRRMRALRTMMLSGSIAVARRLDGVL